MSAETRHAGLTADERSEIRSTVLEMRELIEDDLLRQLQRYGIYEDERVDLDQLGHLDTADKEIRKTVDAALDRELEATEGDYQRSVQNFVREATKTELNRLVALKAIEVRGLVSETLTERPEYGHRSEMLRAVDEVAGELTEQPDGGMGISLSLAYTELSDEIGVIFDESEHTAIDVDFAVRDDVIDSLNDIDHTIWKSDEAMGWVYQYFGEKERDEIDERIDEEKYKVQDTDVATKTQLFTPRYIVEWMVDNSLGRLWFEMHGETTNINDEDKCFYLAPLGDSLIDRQPKDVRNIKVLDPACGSGHMLFYAFDLLYEMYLEQGDVPEKYIPREILKNNLYGIDIDPGAAQLAALALYVKAKGEEPDVEIEGINIVSADAVLVNGEKKDEVLSRTDSDLERQVLEEVWTSFEHIREWGSLVRIEERIEGIIEEKLDEVQATGQAKFADDGLVTQSSVVSYSGEEETWEQVKARLLEQVSKLAEEALEQNDPIEEMFAGEVEKSVRLLDLFVGGYDVVVTNPPYLGSGKMGDTLKHYVKDNYQGSRDLYTAFIERCTEFAGDDGYVTMVTPESFMFLYSYRKLRKSLVSNHQIIEGAHLSGHSFPPKDRPFTIPFVIRNCNPTNFTSSRFYRMTHEQKEYAHHGDKIRGLKEITETHRVGQEHQDVYVVNQNTFKEIGRTPFVYWFGQEILELIINYPSLGEIAEVKQGLFPGDDKLFVRKWWELPVYHIDDPYVRFQRSGTNASFLDIVPDYVYWGDEGERMIKEHEDSRPQNIQYYFKEGLVSRRFGKYFVSRFHEEGRIFDSNTAFIQPNSMDLGVLLGLLNTNITRFIIDGINPGMKFEIGDMKKIPIKPNIVTSDKIREFALEGVNIRSKLYELQEKSPEFNPNEFIKVCSTEGIEYLIRMEEMYHSDVEIIHGYLDEIVFAAYEIPEEIQAKIYENYPNNLARFPHITNINQTLDCEFEFRGKIGSQEISDNELEHIISTIDNMKGEDIRDISSQLEISPYTIVLLRHEHGLYSDGKQEEVAGRLLSYYLGCIMGRWDLEGCTPDENGIVVFDDQFKDNVEDRIRECIELTFDDVYETESDIEAMLGRNPIEWLRDRFFRYHHTKEYRRRGQRIPIYWQLESDDGAFCCFIYYHAMDEETLPKLRGQYIDEKIDTLQNRLDAIDAELDMADGDRARELRSDREEVQADIDDIRAFRERVDRLINEGFAPDFEAGIWENIQKVDEHDLLAVPLDKL